MKGTHRPILTVCILRLFRRVTMTVGNHGGGVHNVILNTGNDDLGVRDIMVSGRNGCICVGCVCCKRLPGAGSQQRSSLKRQNAR